MTERVPDDRSHVRHVAIAVLIGVVGAVLFGVGLWMAFRPDDKPAKQAEIEPAQPTTPSGTTTATGGSPEPTSVAGAGSGAGSAGGSGTATGSQTVTTATGDRIVRAARIAFRLGATLYVANEDGSAATPVYRSDDGPYALSPDGKTIARGISVNTDPITAEGKVLATISAASAASLATFTPPPLPRPPA